MPRGPTTIRSADLASSATASPGMAGPLRHCVSTDADLHAASKRSWAIFRSSWIALASATISSPSTLTYSEPKAEGS